MKSYKFFLGLVFLISCSSENRGNNDLKLQEDLKNQDIDCSIKNDCTPIKFNTPYYRIPYENLKDTPFEYSTFGTKLIENKVIGKNYDFSDIDNSKYINFENKSMLIINPNSETGKLKSLNYDFYDCKKISSNDYNRIINFLEIFNFKDLNVNNFFNFSFLVDEAISTNILEDKNKIIYEISCVNNSGLGQFHIYKK